MGKLEVERLICRFYTAANAEKLFGGVAQLGERLHGMQEVRGSSPLTSIHPNARLRVTCLSSSAATKSCQVTGKGHAMGKLPVRRSKLRCHTAANRVVVILNGRSICLGVYMTAPKYINGTGRLIAEYATSGQQSPTVGETDLAVIEVSVRSLCDAKGYYGVGFAARCLGHARGHGFESPRLHLRASNGL